jgi:hypothetical protein
MVKLLATVRWSLMADFVAEVGHFGCEVSASVF